MPEASKIILTEGTAPSTVAAGTLDIYSKTDDLAYTKNSAGTERVLLEAAASGETTEILVGGGAATPPVWTTATGSGAPVRATSPTLVTPALGTPSSGTLTNCTSDTEADNNSTTQLATTAFAKSQDAVLHRDPDQGVALTAAASGSSGITVADSVHLDHGTGAGFISCKRKLAAWDVAAILMEKHDDSTGYRLSVAVTTGYIVLELNNTTYTSTAAPGFAANTEHILTATWSPGAVNTTVAFYADGVAFGAPAAQANETTTDNAVSFYAMGTDAVRTSGTDMGDIVGNFAPTAAEVLDMYRNGIPESWKWGSQTSLVTGDNSTFASDTGWWTKEVAQITIADGVCHYTACATAKSLYKTTGFPTALKWYNITYTVSGYSSGGIRATGTGSIRSANGTYTERLYAADTVLSFESAGTTTLDIDNIVVQEAGATLALAPESWQADKPYDLSSNNLTCSYPTTGWTLTRPPAQRFDWPAATAETTAVTLTIAKLLTLTITGTHAAGATQAYTLPTGTLCEAWPAFQTVRAFEWTLINLSAAAADTITLTAGADHTIVGNPIIQSAHSSTGGVMGNSSRWRTQRTALNTFVTTRIA